MLASRFLLTAICFGSSASAQQDASSLAQPAPGWSPAQSIGMFAFPKNSPIADQQLKDESDCYGMAKQRTGLDPQKPAPAGRSAEQVQAAQNEAAQNADQVKGTRVGGAARGAAGGAAIGAIAGSAGKSAGAGAVAGTMRVGRRNGLRMLSRSKKLRRRPRQNWRRNMNRRFWRIRKD
jgi:hypothetical protein